MDYDDVTNLLELWIATNDATNMIFSYLFLVCLFVISYVALQKFDQKNSLVASGFILAITSVWMFVAGLMTQGGMITCVIVFLTTLAYMMFEK